MIMSSGSAIYQAFKDVNVVSHKYKKPHREAFCGPDGTRTRDLLRDRQAF